MSRGEIPLIGALPADQARRLRVLRQKLILTKILDLNRRFSSDAKSFVECLSDAEGDTVLAETLFAIRASPRRSKHR